ncbi:MAG: Type 1 glutamine amidotransferase-like domain-containing protein [Gammaproteobacteria bacterium]|nr:Type 1 glutamine amidotransferase-like domain-containing protein [Gammaproteobacteria bacterium]NNM20791.1 type 1 glutamine amidotransferase-like domain-containing protein [Gammaproteobacteria bacterium]
MSPVRLMLGPQRPTPNLGEACDAAGVPSGTLAVISAGLKEAEADIDHVRQALGRPLEDLALYQRAEAVFATDAELAAACRARQDQLKGQQRLYRLRLRQLATAARKLLKTKGDAEMLAVEQRHAIEQLRALDRHHLERTQAINMQCDEVLANKPSEHLSRHRDAVRQVLQRSAGLVITGGNLAIILNRMRLFGVEELIKDTHVVAWSAGAMALAQRIVLFHDRAPHGRREPEIFGAGFGLLPGFIFFPDAAARLRDKDRARMELLSRRFAPDQCIAMDNGTALHFSGAAVVSASNARRIAKDGGLESFRTS